MMTTHDNAPDPRTHEVARGNSFLPAAAPTPVLLKVAEVARRLNCSPSFVYQLVERKRIAHLRIGRGNGGIRFLPADVDLYIASVHVSATSPQVTACPLPKLKHLNLTGKSR